MDTNCYMTSIRLSTLHIAIHLILTTTLQTKYNYCDHSHFKDTKIEDKEQRKSGDGT